MERSRLRLTSFKCSYLLSLTPGQQKRRQYKLPLPQKVKPCRSSWTSNHKSDPTGLLLREQIQHRFGRRSYADDAWDKLFNRLRGGRESLGAYTADLRLCVRQGYPTFDIEVQKELALQAFIQGLQPE
ncbi:hypothetical protein ABVT39_008160 [Epinephelus coioides]